MYLPTPKALIEADACQDQRALWADLFFDGDLLSTKQVEWTAERLQTCLDAGVDLVWGFEVGLGRTLPRSMALTLPLTAYLCARFIDKGPRDDTRQAALGSEGYAYLYARYVDEGPRDDTRQAACSLPEYALDYARFIDKGPRDDTRQAALGSDYAYLYARYVDKPCRK